MSGSSTGKWDALIIFALRDPYNFYDAYDKSSHIRIKDFKNDPELKWLLVTNFTSSGRLLTEEKIRELLEEYEFIEKTVEVVKRMKDGTGAS